MRSTIVCKCHFVASGAERHGVVAVVTLPSSEKHGAIVVAGQVASESNLAHGPLVVVEVGEEQVVEVCVEQLLFCWRDGHQQN